MRVSEYIRLGRLAQQQPRITWQFSKWSHHHDFAMIEVPVAALDKLWSKDTLYLGPGDPGIKGRLDRLRKHLAKGTVRLDAPEVTYHADRKKITVEDGRHRISLIRELGIPKIQVSVESVNLKDFLKGVPGSRVVKPPKRVEPPRPKRKR
jgi:hypothetical protein